MAKPPVKGGGGGMPSFLSTIIKFFMVFGVIFAIFQLQGGNGFTIKGVWSSVSSTSVSIGNWITNVGNSLEAGKIDLGIGLNNPVPVVLDPKNPEFSLDGEQFNVNTLLESAKAIPTEGYSDSVAYDRYEWRHWDNVTSCWTVREEVLWRDSVKDASLTMFDKSGKRVQDKNNACSITGGNWIDPYTGKTFTNPSDLDIDHMIPLGYAARAGGQTWDSNKKMDYANDMNYEYHLIAVSASANRSKSDRGPSEWSPREEFKCQYGVAWTIISNKWQLSLKGSDKSEIQNMLSTCSK
jgi:hypothetical protein